MEYYWIPHENDGFIIKAKDQTNNHKFPKNKIINNITDLTKLVHLHQASILHVLK